MFISGQPYTNFKGVNVKDGKLRFRGTSYYGTDDYGLVLKVEPDTISAEREVYFGNGSGTAMVIGYHATYGTAAFRQNTNIAASGVAQASVTVAGVTATSVILVSVESTAATNVIPIGAKYATTDKIWVFYHIGVATAATCDVPFSYVILEPKTG